MSEEKSVINIYRGIHKDSGDIHYFVGTFEGGGYIQPPPKAKQRVIGNSQNEQKWFRTLSDALSYKGYSTYNMAAAVAGNKWGYSKVSPDGWDVALGEDYLPWASKNRKVRK